MNDINIPGLKEVFNDLKKISEQTVVAQKEFLELAIAGEKMVKATVRGNKNDLKNSIETTKTYKNEIDKQAIAEQKIADLQTVKGKKLIETNLILQRATAEAKNQAKANLEGATALEKLNAKINESTKKAKDLGAQMILLDLEGKKNTKQYKDLEKSFVDASKSSKTLNDSYRDISKTAGDNRALVGSYSTELKGHFESVTSSVNSLKGNLASGNIGGAFNDARTIVNGFGQAVKTGADEIKGITDRFKNTNVSLSSLKENVKDSAQKIRDFTKTGTGGSEQMKLGLERLKIGFRQNQDALNAYKNKQIEANVVNNSSNETTKKGSILTNLWTRAQLILAGSSGTVVGGLKMIAIAFLSTGIGAFIVALGLLISYFSTFTPLIDFLQQKFAGLQAAFKVLQQATVDFIKNITSFGDFMGKLANAIAHPIDSFKDLSKEMGKAQDAAEKLTKAQQDLGDEMEVQELRNRESENTVNRLMLQAKGRGTSEVERMKLLKEASNEEKKNYNENNSLATKQKDQAIQNLVIKKLISKEEIEILRKGHAEALQLIKERQDAGNKKGGVKVEDSDFDALKESYMKKQDLIGRSQKIQETINNRDDALAEKQQKKREIEIKDNQDSEKKSLEFTINAKKTALDFLISSYNQEDNLLDDNLAHITAISLKKKSIADFELRVAKIGITNKKDLALIDQADGTKRQQIDKEMLDAETKLKSDNSKFEIALYNEKNKYLLESGATITDLLIKQEKDRLQEVLDINKKHLSDELKLDELKIKQKQKTNQILTISEKKFLNEIDKLEKAKLDGDKKTNKISLDSKIKDLDFEEKTNNRKFKLENKSNFENAKNQLKNEKNKLETEQELYKNDAEKKKEIDLSLAENKTKLKDLVANRETETRNLMLNGVIEAAGKESTVGKAAAIAQSTINTYEGITKTLAEYPGPLGITLSVLQGIAGFRAVTEIAGVDIGAFATGTDYAPYTGKAVVDEIGAEIQTDKYGKIKSFGSDAGARLTNIVQGDRIIPADISAIIRANMYSNIGLSQSQQNQIDYAEMGKYFDKSAMKIVNAVNNKQESNMSVLVQKDVKARVTFKGIKV